ncbi:MAG: hypothetical protein ACOC1Z_03485 [Cyanobacteriota bacterium]
MLPLLLNCCFLFGITIGVTLRESLGYPQPIVDHKQQQREFKRRYQEKKEE